MWKALDRFRTLAGLGAGANAMVNVLLYGKYILAAVLAIGAAMWGIVSQWGPLGIVLAAGIAFVIVLWGWVGVAKLLGKDRLHAIAHAKNAESPVASEFMPLHEAARLFYEEMRHTRMGAESEWDPSPEGILNWYGHYMAKTKSVSVYGKRPPSTCREKISPIEAKHMRVIGGAKELVSKIHEEVRYIDLEISTADFKGLLERATEEWPQVNT